MSDPSRSPRVAGGAADATRVERLTERLRVLNPERLEVVDDSHHHAGHTGAADGRGHFTVLVVSRRFSGVRTLQRHLLVYEVVGDMMSTDIHALSIHAFAPGESWTRKSVSRDEDENA